MIEIIDELKAKKSPVCIVGLGYVGLPLAVSFARKFKVIGFDIREKRIDELKKNIDITGEIPEEKLRKVSENIIYTNNTDKIKESKFIIICVPTPVDEHKVPDLKYVIQASKIVANNLQKGSIIVYESTVYPGVTEEICVPVIEKESGLKWKRDFFVGYSPERINPGDKEHTLEKIVKVVSGDTEETLKVISEIYNEIIEAGIYKASSIKVAEAAKVIENTQRDLNIALMNELALIFHKLGIDTQEVLKAAGTKWNFLKFYPGLVGGHCIGVDPYYLTFKAQEIGYHPEVILAGRRINDYMGYFIAEETIKLLIKGGHTIKGSRVGILGFTFKENISDIRNTRVIDIVEKLKEYHIEVLVYDPKALKEDIEKYYKITPVEWEELKNLDGIIVSVSHDEFKKLKQKDFDKLFSSGIKKVLVDVKAIYNSRMFDNSYLYWRL